MAKQIQLGDHQLTIVKTTRRGSIALKVSPDGASLMVPKQFSDQTIAELVASQAEWLLSSIDKQQAKWPAKMTLQSGGTVPLFGEPIRYIEDHVTAVRSLQVRLEGDQVCAFLKTHRQLKLPQATLQQKWMRFYRQQLADYLLPRLVILAAEMGVTPGEVTIRTYRSRWGSCYADGRIQFNWRLAMAPKPVIDYVIVHELCHLVHPNHSRDFWQLVQQYCPDMLKHKAWIKQQGPALMAF